MIKQIREDQKYYNDHRVDDIKELRKELIGLHDKLDKVDARINEEIRYLKDADKKEEEARHEEMKKWIFYLGALIVAVFGLGWFGI